MGKGDKESNSVEQIAQETEPSRPAWQDTVIWPWRWEIAASTLSMASMVLPLAALVRINNQSLDSWTLPIRPNSAIAICTTVGKSAMLVSVASCIGQLKWRYFAQRVRRLDDLQTFDEASRGPWGAITVLVMKSTKAWMISALAFVTVVSLAIEPAAQQILKFRTHETELVNITASVGIANSFVTSDPHWSSEREATLYRLIVSSMLGYVFPAPSQCSLPASRCTWDDYKTLAVCSEFQNFTGRAVYNCSQATSADSTLSHTTLDVACTYKIPGMPGFQHPLTVSFTGGLDHDMEKIYSKDTTTSMATVGGVVFASIKAFSGSVSNSGNFTPPADMEVYSGRLFWCARTVRGLSATPDGSRQERANVEPLSFIRGTFYPLHTPPAPQKLTTRQFGNYIEFNEYRQNSTSAVYEIESRLDNALWGFIESLFLVDQVNGHTPGGTILDVIDSLRLFENLGDVAQNISSALSNYMASSASYNSNATQHVGVAYAHMSTVVVQWGWLILPITEALLVTVLLAVTIVVSRGMPLWKTSALAALFHGLEGEVPDRASVGKNFRETDAELESRAKKVRVKLSSTTGAEPVLLTA